MFGLKFVDVWGYEFPVLHLSGSAPAGRPEARHDQDGFTTAAAVPTRGYHLIHPRQTIRQRRNAGAVVYERPPDQRRRQRSSLGTERSPGPR